MMTIEKGVRERRMGDAVRLQYDPDYTASRPSPSWSRSSSSRRKIFILEKDSPHSPIYFNCIPRWTGRA